MTDWMAIQENALHQPNLTFLIVLASIFVLSLIGQVRRGRESILSRLSDNAPGLLTGIGLLGTFLGIYLGLLRFDVTSTDAIQSGVPALLEGMKTAFLTSVAGLSLAMTVKLSAPWLRRETMIEDATAADVVAAVEVLRHDSVSESEKLRNAIVGDGTSSIVSQLRAFRDEQREAKADVLNALENIGQKLAENATKALIAALEEAIKDFNTKITEQFGQNFAKLNDGVGRLLEWQENYRRQLTELTDHFHAAAEAARLSSDALARIAERSQAVVSATESLRILLTGLDTVRQQLETQLDAFAQAGQRAGEAIPRIEHSIAVLTEGFSAKIDALLMKTDALATAFARRVEEATAQLAAVSEMFGQKIDTTTRTIEGAVTQFADQTTSLTTSVSRQVEATLSGFSDRSTQVFETVGRQIDTAMKAELERLNAMAETGRRQAIDEINRTFASLDEALQRELTRALEALGGRLAAVTRTFATDFENAIRDLRQAARVTRT